MVWKLWFALAVVIAALPLGATLAVAHSVAVDGDPTDWTVVAPPNLNTGHIDRDVELQGEYVWLDNPGDERTDFGSPDDPSIDLLEFRVTADDTYLCFNAILSDIIDGSATGDGAPMVQIAIDLDRQAGSGQVSLGGYADTQIHPDAAWEYLVLTRFGSNTETPKVLDTAWIDLVNGNTASATNVISDVTDAIEICMRWDVMGFAEELSAQPLRFTVATFRANASDNTWDVGGSYASNALDAVTNYGDPGSLLNTWDEVSDQVVDYYVDIWFQQQCAYEPASPVLISEVMYDPPTAEPGNEWIELQNTSGFTIDLQDYKVGNEETLDEGEGMYQFPTGAALLPGQVIVVANSAQAFVDTFGSYPDYELADTETAVPNMAPYSLWATGSVNLSNIGDQVIVLDGSDTAMDVVTYGEGTWPGVTPHPGANDWSIERQPADRDTNDCSLDFIAQPSPDPGAAIRNQPDATIVKQGPLVISPGQTMSYTMVYTVSTLVPLTNATISDDLPSEVEYSTYTASPAISLVDWPDPLIWDAGNVCGFWTGQITVTVDVDDSAQAGTKITNEVEIAANGDTVPGNNTAGWETTIESTMQMRIYLPLVVRSN
jgi:hypothetical protein